MTDWICKEVQTDNGGYLEPVKELIRCKDCKYYDSEHEVCCVYISYRLAKDANDYCSDAERKEE